MTVSEQLRRALRYMVEIGGWTQGEIAHEAGLSETSLSRFLNGSRGVALPVFDELCRVAGVELRPASRRRAQ